MGGPNSLCDRHHSGHHRGKIVGDEKVLQRSELQLRRAQRIAKLYCWHIDIDPATGNRISDRPRDGNGTAHCSIDELSVRTRYIWSALFMFTIAPMLPAYSKPFSNGERLICRRLSPARPDGSFVPVRSMVERIRNEAGLGDPDHWRDPGRDRPEATRNGADRSEE